MTINISNEGEKRCVTLYPRLLKYADKAATNIAGPLLPAEL